VLSDKYEQLCQLLRGYESCLVAYSGGVDSVFLAFVANRVLGGRALAAIADSPSFPRRELQEALELGSRFGFPVRVIETQEFANPQYLANPNNRCYFCKHELFTHLTPLARSEKFAVVAYGENASDVGDHRPGAQAATEFQIRAPLKEAGLTKQEIRELSEQFGLPTADKPQMACLSSRVPYGEEVSVQKLAMIEAAENALRDLGFYDVRVRHHELRIGAIANGDTKIANGDTITGASRQPVIHLARIEIGPSEFPRLLQNEAPSRITAALKAAGYYHITLDLQGYRRGSTNEKPAINAA